ncbi:hypothetical protein MEQU1_000692 [Malassezia equina]|uniref:NAD-dependent epimerase/dehydratase domain-containing protein n=1 Tax=Malassezia equina TaxID=1381935 RepID=A0AAF0J2J0_9BASI|nr:hypothetical protein MEQU1_000692 [Malassezia equina]
MSTTVLITGVTGFIACHVLQAALDSPENYRVRGTLRSMSKKDELLARLLPEDRERVEFVEVADTASSDLSEAVRDVSSIFHVASPFKTDIEDPEKDLLKPAIDGTLNLLQYANKEPSVKKVVITSSFAAIIDLQAGGVNRPGYVYTTKDWNPATYDEAKNAKGPTAGLFAYCASKALAEKAAWDFMEKEKPSFTLATINPPMVYGPSIQPSIRRANLNTSSAALYNLINDSAEVPQGMLPPFCHVKDVATAHVRAVELPEAMGRRYLLCGGMFSVNHALKFIAEHYPLLQAHLPKGWQEAAQQLPDTSQLAQLDASDAKKYLEMEFRDWKTTLQDCIDDLQRLEQRPNWNA